MERTGFTPIMFHFVTNNHLVRDETFCLTIRVFEKIEIKRKETKKTDRYKKTIDCVLLMSCFFYPKPAGRQKINVSKYKLYITSNFRFYNSMCNSL